MLTKSKISQIKSEVSSYKTQWITDFYNCFAYTIPQRNYIWRQKGLNGNLKQVPLYTTAGTQGAQIFISRLQNKLTPFGKKWIHLSPKDSLEDDIKTEIQGFLSEYESLCNEYKNKIRLDNTLNESYYDLLAGSSVITKKYGLNGLDFCNVPLVDIGLGLERNQSVVRNFKMKLGEIKYYYPEFIQNTQIGNHSVNKDTENQEIDLCEITYFNEMSNIWEYYLTENDQTLLARQYKTSPFKIFHWDKPFDMPYGNGVGIKANPAIRRLNMYIKTNLELLSFSFPMFLAENGALFDRNIEFKPGGIIRTTGDPRRVIPIQLSQGSQAFQFEVQKEEQEIKSIMLDYTLPNDPRQMTAAEVYARTTPQEEVISASTYRLNDVLKDIALDIMSHIYETKIKFIQGFSMTLPELLELIEIRIGNDSDVDTQKIQKIQSFIATVGSFDPSAIYQSVKRSDMLEQLQDAFALPTEIKRTSDEIDAVVQADQQAQANMQNNAMQAQMMIDNNKAQSNAIAKKAINGNQ